jgi:predicted DNA-binding ribbon-helix-helix protein
MRLCNKEWTVLDNICKKENISRNKLIEAVENNNIKGLGLTYLTRLFVIMYYYELSKTDKKSAISVAGIMDTLRLPLSN